MSTKTFWKALEICEKIENVAPELHGTLLAMLSLNLQLANKDAMPFADKIIQLSIQKQNQDLQKLGLAMKGFILSRSGSLKEGVEFLLKADHLFLKQKPSEYTRHLPASSAIWNRCKLKIRKKKKKKRIN